MSWATLMGRPAQRAIVQPLVCACSPRHTQGQGPRQPRTEHTHTQLQGKVIEVFFFSSEEKAPSIERMYSQNLGKLLCTQPSQLSPGGCCPRGAPLHSFLPEPLFPSETALGAPRLSPLLKPLPKTLFTGKEKPGGRWWVALLSPDPQGGGLKSSPSGIFCKPKEIGEQLRES